MTKKIEPPLPLARWECSKCGRVVEVAGEAADVWCPCNGTRTMPRMTKVG